LSLQEAERRRKQSKRDREAEQDRRNHHLHDEASLRPHAVAGRAKPSSDSFGVGHNRGPPLEHLSAEDQRVLTLKEWARLNGFSFMTAKRLIKAGEGPTILQVSRRRIGIRLIDNARWQAARLRSA